jgi:hypothetical protein
VIIHQAVSRNFYSWQPPTVPDDERVVSTSTNLSSPARWPSWSQEQQKVELLKGRLQELADAKKTAGGVENSVGNPQTGDQRLDGSTRHLETSGRGTQSLENLTEKIKVAS